jgi:hypothetical protein
MKRLFVMVALAQASVLGLGGSAPAAQDPLEAAAVAQARKQSQDAAQVGVFLTGSGPKTDFQVLLEGNKCYWFSGTSQGVTKLYMYLWAPGANLFTPRLTDAKSTGQTTMAHCTTQSGMYKFQVKTEGAGRFVVGVFAKEAPKQVAPPVAAVAPGPDLGPICDKAASVAARGARRVGDFFEGQGSSIGHDDRVDYSVQMEAGKCYWIIGCGEPGKVKALYLYLWGPDNKRVTEAKSDSATPMVGHCAKETGIFKAQAKMAGGKGHYKVGVYMK